MNYQSVRDLKEQVLEQISEKASEIRNANSIEALNNEKPEDRIAVGFSQISKDNFRLELRVQRKSMWAHNLAENIKNDANGEANIEVVPQIEIPSARSSKLEPLCGPILNIGDKLEIGLSIGTKHSGVGTLGAFLSGKSGNFILSCNHVMVSSTNARISKSTHAGDAIYHPGRENNYRLDAKRQIATLINYVPLSNAVENDIDCAIAQIDDAWDYDINRIPKERGYPNEGSRITLMSDPEKKLQRDMVVCKIGRTTCYTKGLVRSIALDRVPVLLHGEGNLLFSNLIEIRSIDKQTPFSEAGDSGALVFTEDEAEAFGIVFAGGVRDDGYKVTFVCQLQPILDWANAQLLN